MDSIALRGLEACLRFSPRCLQKGRSGGGESGSPLRQGSESADVRSDVRCTYTDERGGACRLHAQEVRISVRAHMAGFIDGGVQYAALPKPPRARTHRLGEGGLESVAMVAMS